jgi:hypothetical protein
MAYRNAPTSRPKSVHLTIAAPTSSIVAFVVFTLAAVAHRAYFHGHSGPLLAVVSLSFILAIADIARWLSTRKELSVTLAALNEGSEADSSALVDESYRADVRSGIVRWALAILVVAGYAAFYALVTLLGPAPR